MPPNSIQLKCSSWGASLPDSGVKGSFPHVPSWVGFRQMQSTCRIVKRDKDNKSRLCLGAFGFVRGAVKFGGEGGKGTELWISEFRG